MKNIILKLLMLFIIMLPACNTYNTAEYTLRYEVTGNAADVSILCTDSSYMNNIDLKNVSLPWSSGSISIDGGDQPEFSAIAFVTNNTLDDATIEVFIYFNGEVVAHETGSGPECLLIAVYDKSE